MLVVESDDALRDQIVTALGRAGYDVSTDYRDGMKSVLAFAPDIVVLGADPPELDCCDLLAEIKGAEHTRNIRVVMLAPGGTAERTRGLDLGADDVMSLPFEPHELLSRVRSQLRNKNAGDVVTAVNEERRTVRAGVVATVAVLIVAGVVSFVAYRRTQEQNTRVYAAITRLQTGVLRQQQLMDLSRHVLRDAARAPAPANDSQLVAVEGRLQKLETQGTVAQTIIRSYEPSVCLIHVVLAFRDHNSGAFLHYAGMTSDSAPIVDDHQNPLVSLTGTGPEVHLDAFGTGFLASPGGLILTNHHVAEPWWQNGELKEMRDQGLEPAVVEMTAYFPGVPRGVTISTDKISSAADVALVKGDVSTLGIKQITLADARGAAVSGAPVVLMGYPTAIDAILARAGPETLRSIAVATKGDPSRVMEELAHRNLIRPITTQGHIGNVLPDKIVYDAQTTSGGSGGPLFNIDGKVIGINFAMVREFGGSNFAIPVGFGRSLLKP